MGREGGFREIFFPGRMCPNDREFLCFSGARQDDVQTEPSLGAIGPKYIIEQKGVDLRLSNKKKKFSPRLSEQKKKCEGSDRVIAPLISSSRIRQKSKELV